MEPIIEINWISLLEVVGIIAIVVGIGLLVIKAAVVYSKKLSDCDLYNRKETLN